MTVVPSPPLAAAQAPAATRPPAPRWWADAGGVAGGLTLLAVTARWVG